MLRERRAVVVIGNASAQFLTKFGALPSGGCLWPERQAAAVLGDVAHELPAGTRIAQLLNGRRRHEARPDQAMGGQISNPRRALTSLLRPGTQCMCRFNVNSELASTMGCAGCQCTQRLR